MALVFETNRRYVAMDIDAYNNFLDRAILELIDMKANLTIVAGGYKPPKCNPVYINPSTGSSCQIDINLRNDSDLGPIQTVFNQWIEDFRVRLANPPGFTIDGE